MPHSRLRAPGQPVLLAIGFAILICMNIAVIWLVRSADAESEEVELTHELRAELADLRLSIRIAESAQRGYLLTEDAAYLANFAASAEEVEPALADLLRLTEELPEQNAAIRELVPSVRAKMAELRDTVQLALAGERTQAMAVVRTGQGQDLSRRLYALGEQISQQEMRALGQRRADAGRTFSLLLAVTLVGTVLIAAVAIAAVHLVNRSQAATLRARDALAEANRSLEERVGERTADLEQANEEIQRFAYIVSHDLRSPLVNIMGFTSELEALRKELGERMPAEAERSEADRRMLADFDESLGFIKSSITKMDRLINAILQLSRAGRREFRPETIDLSAAMETITEAVAHQAQEAGATITVARLPRIVSDRLAVEQVFSNLLDNAVKYLRKGTEGRITVSAEETPAYHVIKVADNGRGIEGRDKERIFEIFRRAGAQDRPGDGIGLAHVRTLVHRIGGKIEVQSQPGQGSVFSVMLPKAWRAAR